MNFKSLVQRYDEFALITIRFVSKTNKNRSLQHFFKQMN